MKLFRSGIVVTMCVIGWGCTTKPNWQQGLPADGSAVKLVLLSRAGCASTVAMRANLDDALKSLRLTSGYEVVDLDAQCSSGLSDTHAVLRESRYLRDAGTQAAVA